MLFKIGIDLGYANTTLIGTATADIIRQPSVITVDNVTHRMVSLGDEAMEIAMNTEDGEALLLRPFRYGMLHSSDNTQDIIRAILKRVRRPADTKIRAIIGVPANFTAGQERHLFSIMQDCDIAECYAVKRAYSAMIGSGYAPDTSCLSVNIGALNTEICLVHKGKVVFNRTEEIGGENFDKAVQKYILEQGEVSVTLAVARAIKERIGAVWHGREAQSISISGVLALTGNTINMSISTEDILGVFEEPVSKVILAVANAVKSIPYDMVDDVFENGIVISGGGACLYGMSKMLQNVLGVKVSLSQNATDAVQRGFVKIHSYLPERMRSNCKDITTSVLKYYTKIKSKKQ